MKDSRESAEKLKESLKEGRAAAGEAGRKAAAAVQESWQEFKEKSNPPFEHALDKITHTAKTARVRERLSQYLGPNAAWIIAGLSLAAIAVFVWRRRSYETDYIEDSLDDAEID